MFLANPPHRGPSTMPSDALRSPNVIPPRTSSTGITPLKHRVSKSALVPVAEADWIAPRKRSQSGTISPPSAPTSPRVAPPKETTPSGALSGASPVNPTILPGHRPDPEKYSTPTVSTAGRTSSWTAEKEKILFGPYDYLFAHPGKDIRTQLIAAFNEWLNVPPESLNVITRVVGMLHTSSLLVDDVEDSSLLRRGLPVAHSIFGTAQTINSANYIYFCALQELMKLGNPKAIEIYTQELLNLHRGQGMDLFWRDTLTCPTEDDYLEMVGNKTGGLFRLAVKLMQVESSSPRDHVPLVHHLSLIFQIRDDYLNLSSPTYTTNKGLCEDLTEGKFSFPIIHSIRSDPSNLQLINILKQKTTDDEVKRYAVAYMEGTGSFEYCRTVLGKLVEGARAMIADEVRAGQYEDGKGLGVMKILEMMVV